MSGSAFDADAFRAFEQHGWDATADRYDTHFGRHSRRYAPALLERAAVGAGTRVLDLACGPGYVAAQAAALGAAVTGVDFAPNMVREAARLHPQVHFEVGDAEQLRFADGGFDAVVMGFGMLHVARPEAVAAEALRVLRPGGRFAFTVWGDPERVCLGTGVLMRAMARHADVDAATPQGPPMFRFADHGETRRLLAGAGFVAPSIETLALTWRMDAAEDLFEAFREAGVRAGATLRAQSAHALDAIRAEVVDAARAWRRDGAFEVPMGAVLASARRPGA